MKTSGKSINSEETCRDEMRAAFDRSQSGQGCRAAQRPSGSVRCRRHVAPRHSHRALSSCVWKQRTCYTRCSISYFGYSLWDAIIRTMAVVKMNYYTWKPRRRYEEGKTVDVAIRMIMSDVTGHVKGLMWCVYVDKLMRREGRGYTGNYARRGLRAIVVYRLSVTSPEI